MYASRRTVSALLLAAAGLPACGAPCHPWDELPIDASAIAEPDEPLARVREGIDRFVEWTERGETCVQGVEIVEEIPVEGTERGVAGRYLPNTRTVLVKDSSHSSTTTHELCHSLDHEEGDGKTWASEAGWDLLAPYGVDLDPVLYPTEEDQVIEVFARFCDDGPQVFAVLDQLAETCGFEGASEAGRFVRDIAFPDYDADAGWEDLGEPFTYELDTVAFADIRHGAVSRSAEAVAGEGGLYVLDHAILEDEAGVWTVEPRIHLVDPDSLAVLDTLALDPHPIPPRDENGQPVVVVHRLVGSTGAPMLQAFAGEQAGAAWRIARDPLRIEPAALPDLGDEGRYAFEHDGVAFALVDRTVVRVDLAGGAVEPVAADDTFDPSRTDALYADETGALAATFGPGGLTLVPLDWAGAPAGVRDFPLPTGRVRSLFRLPDGSTVVTPVVDGTTPEAGGATIAVSLRHDPATDAWSAADDGCGGLAGYGWVTVGDTVLRVQAVEVEAGAYALEAVVLGG